MTFTNSAGARYMADASRLAALAQQRAHLLRDSMEAKQLATRSEIAACWPGGCDNPSADLWAWLVADVLLERLLTQQSIIPDRAREEIDDRDTALIASLTDAPVILTLGGVAKREIRIFPKSFAALAFLDDVSARARTVSEEAGKCVAINLPAFSGPVLSSCVETIRYLLSLLAWGATHPGPGLPFDHAARLPAPPAWIDALTVDDLRWCERALWVANGGRATRLLPRTDVGAPARASQDSEQCWAERFRQLANELHATPDELSSAVSAIRIAAASIMLESLTYQSPPAERFVS